MKRTMDHTHGTFSGAGGLALFYQRWRPEAVPRTVALIVHGVGEHSGRYENVVAGLVPRGHAVSATQERGRPLFLLAHSMGALIALDWLPTGQHALAGAIISGAPISPVGVTKPILVAVARGLSRV